MVWRRVGWVDVPDGRQGWWVSHMGFPTVVSAVDGEYLVLVASRDELQRSSCAYVKLKVLDDCVEVVEVSARPLLEPGSAGCFDESGVNVSFATESEGVITAWYHGWFLRMDGGWINSIGVAQGDLKNGLSRISPAPTFDRSASDPTSLGYPFWYRLPTGDTMFYCSYDIYGVPSLGQPYSYRVKSVSCSKLDRSLPLLPHVGEFQAQSRPCVVHHDGMYRMFLSVKGTAYHIRSAESIDGNSWKWSEDKWSFMPLGSGGEKNETAYSFVIPYLKGLIMFYNGDNHGETGFGVAVWND